MAEASPGRHAWVLQVTAASAAILLGTLVLAAVSLDVHALALMPVGTALGLVLAGVGVLAIRNVVGTVALVVALAVAAVMRGPAPAQPLAIGAFALGALLVGRQRASLVVAGEILVALVALAALIAAVAHAEGLAFDFKPPVAIGLILLGAAALAARPEHLLPGHAERVLAASEARLRATLESAPDAIVTTLFDGTVAASNQAARSAFGYDEAELAGHALVELVAPADRPALSDRLVALRRGDPCARTQPLLVHAARKDGSLLPVEVTFASWQTDQGLFLGAFLRDVSDREAAAAAVRRSEANLRLLLGASPHCIWVARGGEFVFVNPAHARVLGYQHPEELLGRSVEETLHPDDRPFAGGRTSRFRRRDGVEIVLECVALGLELDGEPSVYVTARDVTEPLRAEEALRRTTSLWRSILDSANYAVLATNAAGIIEEYNATAERWLGYPRGEIVGAATPLRFHDAAEVRGRDFGELFARARAGAVDEGEWTYVKKDGSRFTVFLSVTALRDRAGGITGYVAVARDVTESRRVRGELVQAKEAAESAMRARADFLARMSHEIRTPLNGVLGMIDLSLVGELSPEARDNLETARSSADLLLTLVNDILDFSKVDAGKLRLDEVPFAVRDTVAGALRGLGGRAYAKGLALILDVADDVPARVVGDPQRFQQVLVNLVANAIKFTECGEIVVGVRAVERTPDKLRLEVSVTDTGIGIPAAEQASIFDAFNQGERTTARRFGGTGLGLTICHDLVALMGGEISVESEPGRGSRFTFSVLLRPAPRGHATAPVSLPAFGGATILVVERNARQRELLARMLRGWDLVPTAIDANPGALAAVTGSFRLILADAETDATALARLARQLGIGRPGGPELVLLAPSGCRVAAEIQLLAPVAQVTKPIVAAQLLDVVAATLVGGGAVAVPTMPMRPVSGRPRRRILVAEDNAVNRRVARGFLERAGAEVVEVEDGRAALTALDGGEFDLVLMDVEMPVMDGLEAIRTVRTRERAVGGVRLPIVAVTAQAMVGDQERCLEAGADAYIAKPFDARELAAAIERLAPVAPPGTGPVAVPPLPSAAPVSAPVPVPVVDRNDLLLRIGGSAEVYAEIVGIFLGEGPKLRDELARVTAGDDAGATAVIAHKLKGMLGSMSARTAADAARRLEENARDGGGRLRELAARLDEALRAVEVELAREVLEARST